MHALCCVCRPRSLKNAYRENRIFNKALDRYYNELDIVEILKKVREFE